MALPLLLHKDKALCHVTATLLLLHSHSTKVKPVSPEAPFVLAYYMSVKSVGFLYVVAMLGFSIFLSFSRKWKLD